MGKISTNAYKSEELFPS